MQDAKFRGLKLTWIFSCKILTVMFAKYIERKSCSWAYHRIQTSLVMIIMKYSNVTIRNKSQYFPALHHSSSSDKKSDFAHPPSHKVRSFTYFNLLPLLVHHSAIIQPNTPIRIPNWYAFYVHTLVAFDFIWNLVRICKVTVFDLTSIIRNFISESSQRFIWNCTWHTSFCHHCLSH